MFTERWMVRAALLLSITVLCGLLTNTVGQTLAVDPVNEQMLIVEDATAPPAMLVEAPAQALLWFYVMTQTPKRSSPGAIYDEKDGFKASTMPLMLRRDGTAPADLTIAKQLRSTRAPHIRERTA